MLQMTFVKEPGARLKVLCLGAHSDDIEIGCGGTIRQLIRECRNVEIFWVVFGANDKDRRQEAVNSAELLLEKVENKTIIVKAFEDTCFPFVGKEIKAFFQEIKASFQPDLIFTHYRHDLHQDHPDITENLRTQLFNYLKSVGAKYPEPDPQYDPEKEKAYLDKIINERWPQLEKQRLEFLSRDYDPGNGWWGSFKMED